MNKHLNLLKQFTDFLTNISSDENDTHIRIGKLGFSV